MGPPPTFCYVGYDALPAPGGFASRHFFRSPVRNSADSFSGCFTSEEPRRIGIRTLLGSTCFDFIYSLDERRKARTLPPLMLIYGKRLLGMNELHRTIRPDSRRHHTKDANLGLCNARRDGFRPRLGRRQNTDNGRQGLSCQSGRSGGSDAPGERVPQKSEGDGTVSSNHDMVSQLQEGKLEKGRCSCSVSFELRSELIGAQVLERTEGWCQNSKF